MYRPVWVAMCPSPLAVRRATAFFTLVVAGAAASVRAVALVGLASLVGRNDVGSFGPVDCVGEPRRS